jgi:hypothetical protein
MSFPSLPAILLLLTLTAAAQPAAPATDAWPLYEQAARRISEGDRQGFSCPAASDVVYSYPPFPDDWKRRERTAYEFNASALQKVHEATSIDHAGWPVQRNGNDVDLKYLNELRNIANEVADAAVYDHLQGNNASALGRINNILHIADLLDQPKDELIVQGLVATGIRSIALDRLEMIAPELPLKKDSNGEGQKAVPAGTLRDLIRKLFTPDDLSTRVTGLIEHERALNPASSIEAASVDRVKTQYRRLQMEQNLAAMSLAAQLYRSEKSRWPASLDDLLPYLPAKPTDFWGPLGYVLIRGDGPDRPLVYSRCNAQPGQPLVYPVGTSVYSYYQAPSLGLKPQPVAGQFRDVSPWLPPKSQPAGLRPLK